jgi:hypothetical protein
MFSLRLFPSFERPVDRKRYLNVQPQRRGYGVIGAVAALSALLGTGIVLALPETSQLASAPPRAVMAAKSNPQPAIEQTAAAEDERLGRPSYALCTEKPTARRACVQIKAAREARLAAGMEPEPPVTSPSPSPAAVAATPTAAATATASSESGQSRAEPPPQAAPAPAPRPKVKIARTAVDTPTVRRVHVYDHIAPDGRRVPVYRRPNGGYEFGAIEGGEYRPSRSAELGPPRRGFTYFRLQ